MVETDRGGQVTYHGPGQVVAYTLLDLRRRRLGVRELVCRARGRAIIDCLGGYGIAGACAGRARPASTCVRDGATGAKIAALGLKVTRGCTYHGVALNVAMDLDPVRRIDPCGYPGPRRSTDIARSSAGARLARLGSGAAWRGAWQPNAAREAIDG